MKRIFYYLLSIALAMCVSSCNKVWHPFEDYYTSAIIDYMIPTEVDLSSPPHKVIEVTSENDYVEYYRGNQLRLNIPTQVYAHQVSQQYDGELNYIHKRHGELSELYGDTSFNAWLIHDVVMTGSRSWAFPFEELSIVSDDDYDENHPAGTPLDDIVEIKYDSYRPFIESGYKDTSTGSGPFYARTETKRISDIVPEDAIFMEPKSMVLIFPDRPTLSKHHRLTLTIKFESRRPCVIVFDVEL